MVNRSKTYFINGLKKRSSIRIEVPIEIENIVENPGFFNNYEGNLETVIKYKEFFASGNDYKNQILIFKYLK
jgi:hypothetical protein